jgi:hypothetical protein
MYKKPKFTVKIADLNFQIVAHHDDLLSQATGVETLEGK